MSKNKNWYRIENKAADEAEVYIYGEIVNAAWYTNDVEASQFVKDFAAIDAKTIRIRINSPGGSVFAGVAIHGAIQRHPSKTIAHIDGLAASAASFVALAADEVRMAEGAMYMIHDGWTFAIGNKVEMRRTADLLEKTDGSIVRIYAGKTGRDESEISEWMADETWFTADEALEAGFVDEIEGVEPVKASFDMSRFKHAPKNLAELQEEPGRARPETVREMEALLREEGGFSNAEAKRVASAALKALEDSREEGDPVLETQAEEPTEEDELVDELFASLFTARLELQRTPQEA